MQVELAERWLSQVGVLRESLKPAEQSDVIGSINASGSDDDGGDCAGDVTDPCPTCGRTYFHVHRPAIRQSALMAGVEDDGF